MNALEKVCLIFFIWSTITTLTKWGKQSYKLSHMSSKIPALIKHCWKISSFLQSGKGWEKKLAAAVDFWYKTKICGCLPFLQYIKMDWKNLLSENFCGKGNLVVAQLIWMNDRHETSQCNSGYFSCVFGGRTVLFFWILLPEVYAQIWITQIILKCVKTPAYSERFWMAREWTNFFCENVISANSK